MLASLSADERAAMWRAVLDDPGAHGRASVFVAEDGSAIIAFASCGAQRDPALAARGFEGEFGAIYVLRSHQRAGLGRALLARMAQRLRADGRAAASLWVLRENAQARAFYEALDGALLAEKAEQQAGGALVELAYGWPDLAPLLKLRCGGGHPGS